eukprot:g17630.t1
MAAKRPSLADMLVLGERKENTSLLDEFFLSLRRMSKHLNSKKVGKRIIQQTCKLLRAQRATLYYLDGDELTIMVAKGTTEVNFRLKRGQGIAGWVAENRQLARVSKPTEDPRFDDLYDKKTSFKTLSVLAAPIFNPEGLVVAVLEALNKQPSNEEGFFARDEVLLENLAIHSGIVLRNAQLYEAAKLNENKVAFLFNVIEALRSSDSVNKILHTLATQTNMLVNADRCTLYLVDRARSQLIVMQETMELRIPMSKGIAGHVAQKGEVVNIPDCYKDSRFNQAVDKKTGYRTRSMLCMPVFSGLDENPQTLGVLQVINKKDAVEFGPADESIITKLLDMAGPLIAQSPLFASIVPQFARPQASLVPPGRGSRMISRTTGRSPRGMSPNSSSAGGFNSRMSTQTNATPRRKFAPITE